MSNYKLPQHAGIDFGNHSIKLVYLKKDKTGWILDKLTTQKTPIKALNSYDDENKNKIALILQNMVKDAEIPTTNVAFALPENSVFTKIIEIPKVKDSEVEEAVYWQLKKELPYPIDEVQKDHMEISKDLETGARKVLTIAAPKKLIYLYQEILDRAGLTPVAIESEMFSVTRAVKHAHQKNSGIILDFGALSTNLGIYINGDLLFSQSISTGSDLLTKAIATEFNLKYTQAEQYKRAYGIKEDIYDGKLFKAQEPILNTLSSEIIRAIDFFRTSLKTEAPQNVFLTGDAAKLPGLPEYIQKVLGIKEVTLTNSWNNIQIPKELTDMTKESGPSYTVAIGLSLKEE